MRLENQGGGYRHKRSSSSISSRHLKGQRTGRYFVFFFPTKQSPRGLDRWPTGGKKENTGSQTSTDVNIHSPKPKNTEIFQSNQKKSHSKIKYRDSRVTSLWTMTGIHDKSWMSTVWTIENHDWMLARLDLRWCEMETKRRLPPNSIRLIVFFYLTRSTVFLSPSSSALDQGQGRSTKWLNSLGRCETFPLDLRPTKQSWKIQQKPSQRTDPTCPTTHHRPARYLTHVFVVYEIRRWERQFN